MSGLTLTSTSGYTLPLALTVSIIVRLTAFSVVTFVPSSLPMTPPFLRPIKTPITTTNATIIQINFLLI